MREMEATDATSSGRKERRRKWWSRRLKNSKPHQGVDSSAKGERGRISTVVEQTLISSSAAGFRKSSQPTLGAPQTSSVVLSNFSTSNNELSDSSCEESSNLALPCDAAVTNVNAPNALIPHADSSLADTDAAVVDTPHSVTVSNPTRRKSRYIAFIGNLPFTATSEDVIKHFKRKGVRVTEVRLLTKKGSGESKGCCFAEFPNAKTLQNALKFHRNAMEGRRLNIEVTCGGGGRSECRMKKIRDRNVRLRKSKRQKTKTKIQNT